ncbi:MAG: T9SS type A sorting domain-containing protein, partial [Saprospiraceae bacterium]|nr:T9SS type A sorting domain-containing protein [Saprospiraceae bacterium]
CGGSIVYDVLYYPRDESASVLVVSPTVLTPNGQGDVTLMFSSEFADLPSFHPIRTDGLPYNIPVCSMWPDSGGVKEYHRIQWRVIDGCGNLHICDQLMRLEDCQNPEFACVGLSSVVMPSSGEVTLFAQDFYATVLDDCTPAEDMMFSFSGETYQPTFTINCETICENNGPTFDMRIWAADGGNDLDCSGVSGTLGIAWDERNKFSCQTFIVLDDNQGVCGANSGGDCGGPIGGNVETWEGDPVNNVEVTLKRNDTIVESRTTFPWGTYQFGWSDLDTLHDYTIEAFRNDNHRNGVSTLDLIKIQKHLLGIEPLDGPYRRIAADANGNESITTVDLLEIRKVILGLNTEFPDNLSWRFVPEAFNFADPDHPWPFAETIAVFNFMEHNFIGIKIGDVNGTVDALATDVAIRSGETFTLEIADRRVEAGKELLIEVRGTANMPMLGIQMAMRLNGLSFNEIKPGTLDIGPGHVGELDPYLTLSWSSGQPAPADGVLFTLYVTAWRSGWLRNLISLDHQQLAGEAYDHIERMMDLALRFAESVAPDTHLSLSATPNPFSNSTVISLELSEPGPVHIIIHDPSGHRIFDRMKELRSGRHQVELWPEVFESPGVYLVSAESKGQSETIKLVRL